MPTLVPPSPPDDVDLGRVPGLLPAVPGIDVVTLPGTHLRPVEDPARLSEVLLGG